MARSHEASRHDRGERYAAARGVPAPGARPALAPPADPGHPAYVLAAIVAAACIAYSVSFVLYDTDMWQHLAVGRAIWQLRSIPTHQLWTWPNYGTPDINASWGFRLLIWPLWHAFGVPGLFAWRWLTTLAAFALLWAAARRMGARGLSPLVVAVLCSLTYRHRSQVRPETLVAVLFAAELWILEGWRSANRETESDAHAGKPAARGRPRDPRPWLVLIALIWANVHISYWIGLTVQGIYLLGGHHPQTGVNSAPRATPRRAGWRFALVVLTASALISLVNPWGWKALWQPFDYFLHWRHEPIFQTIGELQPVDWGYHARNGLAVLIGAWVVLLTWRARTFGLDRVEALMFALLVGLALPTQRFVGLLALGAFPFVSRDLDALIRSRGRGMHGTWAQRFDDAVARAPWLRGPWLRGALAAAACIAIGIPEWTRPSALVGVRLEQRVVPVRACDFMEAHGVRGRGFNQFAAGGYMVYRFWPDRGRLPFIDIHQSGSREDRYLYAVAQQDSDAWHALDDKYRFDYVLIYTHQYGNDRLTQFLDADPARWALLFTDDAAAIFVRRDGPLGGAVHGFEYHRLPAGIVPNQVLERCEADSLFRHELETDLERSIRESPWNSRARLLIAPLLLMDGRLAEARATLDRAILDSPLMFELHAARGEVELAMGDGAAARNDFQREIQLTGKSAYLDQALERSLARPGGRAAVP